MKKQMKNTLLVGIMIFLLTACGQSAPTPAPINVPGNTVIGNPTNDPGQFRKYIGLVHPPLSESLSNDFAMLIQNAEDHALTLVTDGEHKMLWLDKLTHYDANGTAYWEVKDVLDLSTVEAGLTLIPDGCVLNGTPDNEILVAAKDGTIRLAWRANTTLDRFEIIPEDGIECHSDKGMSLE